MKKVLVVGSGGSGKTTVAKTLAARAGLPLVHLDRLFWHPGWVRTPDDEWDRVIGDLVRQDAWVMDGNYGRTLEVRLAAADAVVFLDRSPLVCTWRLVKRRFSYQRQVRPDVAPGCPEHLTWEFMWWVWTYRIRRRPALLRRLKEVRDTKQVFILQTEIDVEHFLAEPGVNGTDRQAPR